MERSRDITLAKTGVILREGRKGFETGGDSHGDKLFLDQISVNSDNYRGIRRLGDIHLAAKKHKNRKGTFVLSHLRLLAAINL